MLLINNIIINNEDIMILKIFFKKKHTIEYNEHNCVRLDYENLGLNKIKKI